MHGQHFKREETFTHGADSPSLAVSSKVNKHGHLRLSHVFCRCASPSIFTATVLFVFLVFFAYLPCFLARSSFAL